jgi:hypothetical protein
MLQGFPRVPRQLCKDLRFIHWYNKAKAALQGESLSLLAASSGNINPSLPPGRNLDPGLPTNALAHTKHLR